MTRRDVRIPLYERLRNRWAEEPSSFHVPGHKYGRMLPEEPFDWFRTVMRLDVTELADTDDLHHPEDVILEAEQLAAQCFGADETFLLVGGSTAGNLAMILATCSRDDVVIVQRNIHKSIGNGLRLAGAKPVFVRPQFDAVTGTATVPSLTDLEQALEAHPGAKAVILSTPNYYGVSVGLEPYAVLVHRYGMPLLVDEAHGAHYGFHPGFPLSAIRSGADAVVQSTHKTLTALTMGAMLHVRGTHVDCQALREALSTVQSSSPSYPIMASLDIARAMVEAEGPALFNGALEGLARLQRAFGDWPADYPLALVGEEDASSAGSAGQWQDSRQFKRDPLRVLLTDRTRTISGYELLDRLFRQGCAAEMADERLVVLLLGIGTTSDDIDKLLSAIGTIGNELMGENERIRASRTDESERSGIGEDAGALFVAFSAPFRLRGAVWGDRQTEQIAVGSAEGRLAAEPVIPYPPGIPLLYPGEPISGQAIRQIISLAEKGARFQGASDASMRTIRVLRADDGRE